MASHRAKADSAFSQAAPTDQLSVNVPGSAEVSGPPRATLEEAVRDFAIDVLSEASYRESTARGASSKEVQYTSAYFEGAKNQVRSAGVARKPPGWHAWAKVIAPVTFTLAGVAIPFAFAEKAWPGWGLIAGATLVAGVALSAMVEILKGGDR